MDQERGPGSAADSVVVRCFYLGYSALERVTRFLRATYSGVALGLLSQEHLHGIGERRFRRDRMYWTEEWNRRGLFDWERKAVEEYFQGGRRLLVGAAGGGREMLALRRLGFEVDGFEADAGLREVGNRIMLLEGLPADIRPAQWDRCPEMTGKYDGVIIGWSAYMHIRGRENRVRFLRELRNRTEIGAPLLLSFYSRVEHVAFLEAVARTGNRVARLRGGCPVEIGDTLAPNFIHYFTREQLEPELAAGGFELALFEAIEYGHAVGRATSLDP